MTITCVTTLLSPSVPATEFKLLTDFNLGWNASADSIGVLRASGSYLFSVSPTSLGVITGFAETYADTGYAAVTYGFYVHKGLASVMEAGVLKTGLFSVAGGTLEVRRVSGEVQYFIGGTKVYTSQRFSEGTLHVAAYMYSAGDSIIDPAITSVNAAGMWLQPLVSRGGVQGNVGYATLQPLEARNNAVRSAANLQPLDSYSGVGAMARASANLQPLVSVVESGLIIPTYALSAAALPFLDTYSHGITDEVGNAEAYFVGLTALAADHAYGISRNNLQPMEVFGGASWPLNGSVYAELQGAYNVASSGTARPTPTADMVLPAPLVVSYSGASLKRPLPALQMSASGTVPAIARVDAALPMPTLVSNGKVGGASTVYLQHGGTYGVVAQSGAQARTAHAGRYATVASGKVGAVATVSVALHGGYPLSARATAENYATVTVALPSLQAAPSGSAWLVAPSFSLHAAGSEVIAVTYEAYAINLSTGAVSRYTNYPFDNILRFGANYYGVRSDGIYQIGGTIDVDAQIDAHIKTFQTPLGSLNLKRLPYVYVTGRSDSGVVIGVTADEGETYEYESDWGEVAGTANHRVKVGNGIRGVYYALDVKNTNGGSLEVASLEAHVALTQRGV